MKINEEKILGLIATELNTIILGDTIYNDYQFEITNELQYVNKKKDEFNKKIFIVIKMLPATLNFGQTLLPIILDVVAEKNKIDITKRLLFAFAETYNLEWNSDNTIKQYYSTPTFLSNFNEIGNGYRSLITMQGTLQISENNNPYTIKYNYTENGTAKKLLIETITSGLTYENQLDTQAFFSTSRQTKSRAKVGTFILNFSVYMTNNVFLNKVLDIVLNTESNDFEFSFDIDYKNNKYRHAIPLRLANYTMEQNLGELPVANLSFTI